MSGWYLGCHLPDHRCRPVSGVTWHMTHDHIPDISLPPTGVWGWPHTRGQSVTLIRTSSPDKTHSECPLGRGLSWGLWWDNICEIWNRSRKKNFTHILRSMSIPYPDTPEPIENLCTITVVLSTRLFLRASIPEDQITRIRIRLDRLEYPHS